MIRKVLIEEGESKLFMQDAEPLGQLGYKGLDISLFVHPHPVMADGILFVIQGLGHTLKIVYIFEGMKRPKADSITMELDSLYNDFINYIMYERNEGNTDGTKPRLH